MMTPNKWSPFYSWSNFLDYATILGLFILFLFTTQLLVQTLEYAVTQTSLIDQMKRQRDIQNNYRLPKNERKEIPFSKHRRLTFRESIKAVCGEDSFNVYCFIPQYNRSRTMENASRQFIANSKSE